MGKPVEVTFAVFPTSKMTVDMTQFMPGEPKIFDLPQPLRVTKVRVMRKEGLELELEFLNEASNA